MKSDESHLVALVPFASKAIRAALSGGRSGFTSIEARLTVLLEVAETLARVLDIEMLIPMTLGKACSLLNADRCSLFLVDKNAQQLITHFHGGLSEAIKIPLSQGIAGYTATTGKIVNIRDAYEDVRFDRRVDAESGYRTASLLTVPIFNNGGEITGVTEMMNKAGGVGFDSEDVRMMKAFNVFCGTSLDNAKLYQASTELTKQLRTFMELSNTLTAEATTDQILTQILENARAIISANRASLFLFNNDANTLAPIVSVGKDRSSEQFLRRLRSPSGGRGCSHPPIFQK
jgi:GAF domain-containing protein